MTRYTVKFPWWMLVLVIVVAAIGIAYYAGAKSNCDAKNGVLVRGAFGYSCVAGPHNNK